MSDWNDVGKVSDHLIPVIDVSNLGGNVLQKFTMSHFFSMVSSMK